MKHNICIECGVEFTSTRKAKFCSDSCGQKHRYSMQKEEYISRTYEAQKIRGNNRKLEAIAYLGGKCCQCGYAKNVAALCFHHVDPSTKSFALDIRNFSSKPMVKLNHEVDKCILLCSNCHMELHHPNCEI
jgi:hypothetical protein